MKRATILIQDPEDSVERERTLEEGVLERGWKQRRQATGLARELENRRAFGEYRKGRPARRFELNASAGFVLWPQSSTPNSWSSAGPSQTPPEYCLDLSRIGWSNLPPLRPAWQFPRWVSRLLLSEPLGALGTLLKNTAQSITCTFRAE